MSLIDTVIQVKEEIDMDVATAGMTTQSGIVFLSAQTTDVRIDLILAPVDEYSLRPMSPDEEDEEDIVSSQVPNVDDALPPAEHDDVVQLESQKHRAGRVLYI
jgi:hypothetical protein